MGSTDYHFVTHWRVPGTAEEVAEILAEPLNLPVWWPAVYRRVTVLETGGVDRVGSLYDVTTQAWLPYRLRWRFQVTEAAPPRRLALRAFGDFDGEGIWTLNQDSNTVAITYDWRVRAEKPLLRSLSWLLKPIFAANHRWAMATGEVSLRVELARRHASNEAARLAVSPPPPPVNSGRPFLVLTALVLAGLAVFCVRQTRKSDESVP